MGTNRRGHSRRSTYVVPIDAGIISSTGRQPAPAYPAPCTPGRATAPLDPRAEQIQKHDAEHLARLSSTVEGVEALATHPLESPSGGEASSPGEEHNPLQFLGSGISEREDAWSAPKTPGTPVRTVWPT